MKRDEIGVVYDYEATGNEMWPWRVYRHGDRANKLAYIMTHNEYDARVLAEAMTKHQITLRGLNPSYAFDQKVCDGDEYKMNLRGD